MSIKLTHYHGISEPRNLRKTFNTLHHQIRLLFSVLNKESYVVFPIDNYYCLTLYYVAMFILRTI